jgi:hypothetical protein
MESGKIDELLAIMYQVNNINDKQANLVMARDGRIVTVQELINENDVIYIRSNFSVTEDQPIAEHTTKLHDRLIELHLYTENLTAESINLALKEYLCNFYFNKGVSLEYINNILSEYSTESFMCITTLLESKLEAVSSASKQYNESNTQQKVTNQQTAIVQPNELLTNEATARQHNEYLPSSSYTTKLKPHKQTEIFLSIKYKKDTYIINYNFDILSAMHIKKHVNEKYLSLNDWQQKIANIFLKAIGCITQDVEIPEISLTAYHKLHTECDTRQKAEQSIRSIQNMLAKEDLAQFSNVHLLNIDKIKDRSTSNYPIFSSYRKALKQPKENDSDLLNATLNLLTHKKILSLADGYDEKSGKTSKFLVDNLESTTTPISITQADIYNLPEEKISSYKNNPNITIEQIQLNNQKTFQSQGLKDKFDLVVSHKVLCHCERKSFASESCGGIPMYGAEGLKQFLLRIALVIDTTNKDAKAILTGTNAREFEFWKQDIQEFNKENIYGLTAEIARNSAGVFKGVIMHVSN